VWFTVTHPSTSFSEYFEVVIKSAATYRSDGEVYTSNPAPPPRQHITLDAPVASNRAWPSTASEEDVFSIFEKKVARVIQPA